MFWLNFLFAVSLLNAPTFEDGPSNDQIRSSVQRSLPFLEKQGVDWIESKDCVSCHRVSNMIWSHNEAKHLGLDVSDQLSEWKRWAIDSSLAENKQNKIVGLGNKEGVAQFLLADASNVTGDSLSYRDPLVALLKQDQQSDGSWKPGGQLPSQKRSTAETTAVTTMWVLLALVDAGVEQSDPEIYRNAMDYVEQHSDGASTEWYALRLLLAKATSNQKLVGQFQQKIIQIQQPDGGWGWLVEDESDALGTGLALYALNQTGPVSDSSVVRRGQAFLLDRQNEDGSWSVRGTKSKKKEHIEETASYWGTAWASLALSSSLTADNR